MRSFSRQVDKFKAFSLIKSFVDVVVVVDDVLDDEECEDEDEDEDDEELFSLLCNTFNLSCCN